MRFNAPAVAAIVAAFGPLRAAGPIIPDEADEARPLFGDRTYGRGDWTGLTGWGDCPLLDRHRASPFIRFRSRAMFPLVVIVVLSSPVRPGEGMVTGVWLCV